MGKVIAVVSLPLMLATSLYTFAYGVALLMWLADAHRVSGGVHFPTHVVPLLSAWMALLVCSFASGRLERKRGK